MNELTQIRGSVQGVIVGGGGCYVQGECLSGGVSVRETPLYRDPPHGEERAISILLECFLVVDYLLSR